MPLPILDLIAIQSRGHPCGALNQKQNLSTNKRDK